MCSICFVVVERVGRFADGPTLGDTAFVVAVVIAVPLSSFEDTNGDMAFGLCSDSSEISVEQEIGAVAMHSRISGVLWGDSSLSDDI